MNTPTDRREVSSPETAERVLEWMRSHAQAGLVAFSAYDLALELGIARQTVYNATRRLLREGRVTIARKGTGHLYPTTYRIQ